MLDLSRIGAIKPAPQAVFDQLEERGTRARFMVPTEDGDYRAVTWADFAKRIESVALFLSAEGFSPGDRAAIFAPNSVDWLAAALGTQAAGGAMVPVYPASTAEQLAHVIEHSDARVLFVDSAPLLRHVLSAWSSMKGVERIVLLGEALDAYGEARNLSAKGTPDVPGPDVLARRILTLEEVYRTGTAIAASAPERARDTLGAIDLDQTAILIYTSGTTGLPKGVPLTHRNVGQNGLDWLQCNAPLVQEGAVDLLWLPMSHIFGFGEACLGNQLGFTTYLARPDDVLERIRTVRPDVFMSVPAYWDKIAGFALEAADREARRARFRTATGGKLSFCLSGGAGLKREVKELFYENGLLIIEGYGLSECSPTLTLNRPNDFRFDAVGKPLPSVELRLADDGEILAKGPNVFSGYHKDPEATAQAFTEDGWFKTGDIGRYTEDGFLQIIDRKKEILVTAGGKNIPPANIELRYADEPLIRHLVVYGDGKKYLVAGVWLEPEALDAELGKMDVDPKQRRAATEELVRAVIDKQNEKLARYEQIKKFAIVDTPLTVSGGLLTSTLKVRRKKVYEAFHDAFEALYDG